MPSAGRPLPPAPSALKPACVLPSHDDDNTVYDVGDVDDWDDQNAIRVVN